MYLFVNDAGIASRDIKTQNVLVSNEHYAFLNDSDEIKSQFERLPVQCKISDFGEGRSIQVQTRAALETRTERVNRGTLLFMAPELLPGSKKLHKASIEDLMLADLFSLGALLHNLLAPDSHAFFIEWNNNELDRGSIEASLASFYDQGNLPKVSPKYKELQNTLWSKSPRFFN